MTLGRPANGDFIESPGRPEACLFGLRCPNLDRCRGLEQCCLEISMGFLGFDFRRLNGISHPVRVGDVLILPSEAFRAVSANPFQKESTEACLWHGFHPY